MAWSFLQSAVFGSTGAGVSSQAVTYGSNVVAGSKMIGIGVAGGGGGSNTITTVKDGAGNSFTQLASALLNNSGLNGQLTLWALDTPAGDVGTKPTITFTTSLTGGVSVLIQEVSGLAVGSTLAAMIDGTPGSNFGGGGNTTTGSPSYTSTASNEYLVSVYGDNGGGPGTGWSSTPAGMTLDPNSYDPDTHADIGIAYGNSTNGTETAAWGITGMGTSWSTILCAFKLAPAAASSTAGAFGDSDVSWEKLQLLGVT